MWHIVGLKKKSFEIEMKKYIQGVFEVEVFLLTCDSMRFSQNHLSKMCTAIKIQ
jgi:hypothetical protein